MKEQGWKAKELKLERRSSRRHGISWLRERRCVDQDPGLHDFVDGKSNLDNYLLRFGRYTTIAGWQGNTWAVLLSLLLTGKALDVDFGQSSEGARIMTSCRRPFYRGTILPSKDIA